MTFSLAGKRLWVAGHRGMVGRALLRRLEHHDCTLLTVTRGRLPYRRSPKNSRSSAAARRSPMPP